MKVQAWMNQRYLVVLMGMVLLTSSCGGGSGSSASVSQGDSGTQTEEGGSGTQSGSGSSEFVDPSELVASCGGTTELLTYSPVDLDEVPGITPLGNVGGSGHILPTTHTYINIDNLEQLNPVYAPADLLIYRIGKTTYDDGRQGHGIYFYVCEEVHGHFGHVTLLSDTIEAQLGEWTNCTVADRTDCDQQGLEIYVEAGEVIGYAGGELQDGAAGIDFGLVDSRIEEPFHFRDEVPVEFFSVCPYDYYDSSDLEDDFYAKLEANSDIASICGFTVVDDADSALGAWVIEGAENLEDDSNLLGLLPSNILNAQNIISMGSLVWDEKHSFIYEVEESGLVNRAMEDVSFDENQYCFDHLQTHWSYITPDVDGYILMKMTDAETLKIEWVDSGNCPADPNDLTFSDEALTYVR